MLYYLWWILGYEIIEEAKTPIEIIENIKKAEIKTTLREITYANVIVELKSKLPKYYVS